MKLFLNFICFVFKKCVYLITKTSNMQAVITKLDKTFFLDFFTSKQVYSVKGFSSLKKANNYAKKCGCTIYDKLPEGVKEFEYCD